MAVVAGLLARLEAETAGFHARMVGAAAQIDRMGHNSRLSARAVSQLRSSLQGVASQAFGMVGPAGQAANALFALTGGLGALVAAGAAGGLALLILKDAEAIAKLTTEADAAAAATRKLAAARIGSPLLTRLAATEPLVTERDKLQAQIDRRVAILGAAPLRQGFTVEQLAQGDAKLSEMLRKLATFNTQIAETVRQPETVLVGLRREVQLLNQPLVVALRLQAEWAGLVGRTADEFVRLKLELANSVRITKALHLSTFARITPPTETGVSPGVSNQLVEAAMRGGPSLAMMGIGGQTAPGAFKRDRFKFTPEFALMSSLALLQGMQGGPGGFLTAAAGPLAMLNPLAGAISATLGAIFGSGGEEERRHRELMEEARRIRENTDRRGDPNRVSVTILLNGREVSGAILDDVIYGIRRAERRNAQPVLPPG